ncbi:MFS transporter [Psychrobium sp. 1_MG-2023]|uniref:MFS transporter n=1 Tax=Psychrobium sp. 1_MG-2023 TaxID=3062624 RepID=UPI000C32A73A|nr:MFS transporter [Psychrobium sp. 1_MG-2023]MDP2560263.1 MFS transporter [Psychrobium sp. 1_MG-2023]PKF55380.1 MFS transporter [Alteromonadales bacterium alter-6D02]
MPTILTFAFILLGLSAFIASKVIIVPRNVWLLFLVQPLAMSATSLMVFVGGLLSNKIAPSQELATLPVTILILGVALAVIPAAKLTLLFGRKKSLIIGTLVSICGSTAAMIAAQKASFEIFCIASLLLGFSMAFVAQMRFAALESLTDQSQSAKALSVLMFSGIFAAILGPELATSFENTLASPHGFAGSFMALSLMLFGGLCLLCFLEPNPVPDITSDYSGRPLGTITSQPVFIIALTCGVIAYAFMSYIMTATPLSMSVVSGHSLHDTKWVIQSHILAMYLPSLFASWLVAKVGLLNVMRLGCLCYISVIIFALSGHDVMHYWLTMVLLGLGWNFLFLTGTLMLQKSYQPEERIKVQSLNDFSIFIVQGFASLSAGVVLFSQGWLYLVLISIPLVGVICAVTLWSGKSQSNQRHFL